MAKKTYSSAIFKMTAFVLATLLLASAAILYLRGDGRIAPTLELVALSQAIPGQADAALNGAAGAFDRLESSLRRIRALRQNTRAALPGSTANWRQLESQAAKLVEARGDYETYRDSVRALENSAQAALQLSEELLERSGSPAVIQEFQQRAQRIAQAAAVLPRNVDTEAVVASVSGDAAFLQSVADALAGGEGGPDVRPLEGMDSDALLLPLEEALNAMALAMLGITETQPLARDLETAADELDNAAAAVGAAVSGSTTGMPSYLENPWLPLVLIAAAVLLVMVLYVLHRRNAVFEQAAQEQAERNDRNQQAILRLLDEMGSLADGDLTVEATVTEDITGTIADSFNYAIEELRKLVATVNETAIMVDSAAKQTENTAAHMANAADNQAREISAASESIVSMAASIEEVSGNAERSSDVARHSVEVAHKGSEAVRRTIDGMNAIRETIQDTAKRIKRLGESSQEIGNIIELINDIAEQTNILALNASIQASMAGEAGRGFAVVADEVQRLAERSTNATKQIEVLVRTIQSDTNEAVISMERSTTDVVGGALLAENAGAALDEIEQVSNQIASLVQNISGSAREQASSAADVTRRTTKLREISDQTGKATTATAASISKLSELASQLRQSIAGFTLPSSAMHSSALSGGAAAAPVVLPEPSGEEAAG